VLQGGSALLFGSPEIAERYLGTLKADIRLDLHNVLDVLPRDLQISSSCCISFVGPKMYEEAKREIQARIGTGQILFAVMVFKRGVGKHRFTFTEPGSKAWVNRCLSSSSSFSPPLFVDDATDHLRSTAHLMGAEAITCRLFNTGDPKQLLNILHK
jgi:hypothetical protein